MLETPHESISRRLPAIATEYGQAPLLESAIARDLWRDFATYNVSIASELAAIYTITRTDDPEPYSTSADQSADLLAGRMLVSDQHCDHPVWSVDENVAFRVAHDILGHHSIRAGFDRAGEIDVYLYSLGIVPRLFHPCLWVESIGQLAYAV